MNRKVLIQTIGYLLLIWVGYLAGEYCYVPTFKVWGFIHVQPSIEVYDKCIAFTLLTFSISLLFALWGNIWLMVSMIFISWGMFNNFIDEMNNKASYLSTSEQLSLLFALLTTSILIWKHRRK